MELHDRIVDIAFHECWWADINETLTLGKQVRFWAWGLSLAGIATHNDQYLPGAQQRTHLPDNHGKLNFRNRLRMAYVSGLFGLSAFSIALLNLILKRLDFSPVFSTATIVNYLSGVKLYSQDKRAGGSPMDGPDEPPRAAIRRRMIRAIVEVATAGYDRWYILAHSLGTIVAWNGLMEIQQALPNYLDRECWDSPSVWPLRSTSATPFNINAMLPNRPIWVGHREIVNREALFEKFRGVLTYGSPLERFCALWSAMVPINKKEDPFQHGTEWVNVYDPTDPVSTRVYDFDPKHAPSAGHAVLKAQNFPCRASPFLLYSHICYLKAVRRIWFRPASDTAYLLVNQVAQWLVQGGSLAARLEAAPKTATSFWMPRTANGSAAKWPRLLRLTWQYVQWAIVGILLTLLTLLSLKYVVLPFVKIAKGIAFALVKSFLSHVGLSSVIPWIAGLLNHLSPLRSWATSALFRVPN